MGCDGSPSSELLMHCSPPKLALASLRPAYELRHISMGHDLVGNCQMFFSYNGAPVCSVTQFSKWHGKNDEEDIQEGRRVSTVASDP